MNVEAKRAHENLLRTTPRERITTRGQIYREGGQVSPGAGHRTHRKGINSGVPEELRHHRRDFVVGRVGQINPRTGKTWRYEDIAQELGISKGAVARYARVTGVAPKRKR